MVNINMVNVLIPVEDPHVQTWIDVGILFLENGSYELTNGHCLYCQHHECIDKTLLQYEGSLFTKTEYSVGKLTSIIEPYYVTNDMAKKQEILCRMLDIKFPYDCHRIVLPRIFYEEIECRSMR